MFNSYTFSRLLSARSFAMWLIALFLGTYADVGAQNISPQPYVPGSWNTWVNPAGSPFAPSYVANSTGITNGFWRIRFSTPADATAGANTFKTVSDAFGNPWGNQWTTGTVTLGGIQTYNYCSSCSPADDNITLNNNKVYTYNFDDAGYTNSKGVFIETDFTPQDLSTATLTSTSGGSIVLTLATPPSTGENFYCRYSTSATLTSSTLVQMPYNSSLQQARIELPIMASGTTVYFTMYSSPYSLSTIQSAVTTHGEKAHDLLSLSRYAPTASSLTFGGPVIVKSSAGSSVDATAYGTLQSAFAQINSGTHKGSIAISLNGNSTETATASLNATTASSATSPFYTAITIQPVGGLTRTISGTLNAGLIQFNGATNVTIDGLNTGGNALVIDNASTGTAASALRFTNDASNNSINRATLRGAGTIDATTTTGVVSFLGVTATGCDNNTINDCDITASTGGTPNFGVFAQGSTSNNIVNDNNTIQNCRISNYFPTGTTVSTAAGVRLATANNAWTITGNRFFQTASRSFAYTAVSSLFAISVATSLNSSPTTYRGNGFTITNNIIGYNAANGTGTFTVTGTGSGLLCRGIVVDCAVGAPATVISGNTMTAINVTTSAGASGPYLSAIEVSKGSANILNNTVGATSGTGAITATVTGTGGSVRIFAVLQTAGDNQTVNVQNNTVGSISVSHTVATNGGTFFGVLASDVNINVTGNTFGNSTAENIVMGSAASTGAMSAQVIYGQASGTMAFGTLASPNTVQNIRVNGSGSTGLCRGVQYQGTGTGSSIVGNTIRNLTSNNTNLGALNAAAGGQQYSTVGISVNAGSAIGTMITDNTIFNIANINTGTVGSGVCGIGCVSTNSASVLRNRIYALSHSGTSATLAASSTVSPNRAVGIAVSLITGTLLVANNMISLGEGISSNTAFVGLNSQYTVATLGITGALHAYHNTVYIGGTATSSGSNASFAFLRGDYGGTNAVRSAANLVNNIFYNARTSSGSNTGKHYAMGNSHLVASSTGGDWDNTAASFSNYNLLTTADPSGIVANWFGADCDLLTWQSASKTTPVVRSTGLDEQSVAQVTLTFANTSTGDLHVTMGTTPTAVESGGISTASLPYVVSTDYDGQARPGPAGSVNGGALAPDLGADEIDAVRNDISAPAIVYTALGNTANTLDRTLQAVITDASGVDVGSNPPRIYYRKNGGSWFSNPTASTSSPFTFTIVAADMGGLAVTDVVEYYVAAQDLWAPTPNGGTYPLGGNSINPPGTSSPSPAASYTIVPGLTGDYYVGTASCGGNTPTYASLAAALTAYNSSGLGADVNFILTDASISTTTAYDINPNGDADALHKLTIKPCPGLATTITSTDGDLFNIVGGDWVIFDGVNSGGTSMTLVNGSAIAGQDIFFMDAVTGSNPCTNITVKNLTMRCAFAQNTSTSSSYGIFTYGAQNNNLTVEGCTIERVQFGVRTGALSSATFPTIGTIIRNNIIGPSAFGANQIGVAGIVLQNENGVEITGNEIRFVGGKYADIPATATFDRAGIVMSNIFTGNSVWSGNGGGAGSLVKNALVARNNIHDIMALRNGNSAIGIVVAGSDGSNNTNNVIANNMLWNIRAAGLSATVDQAVGIAISHGKGDKVVYNSIYMMGDVRENTSTTVPDMSNYGISVGLSTPQNLTIAGNAVYMDLTTTGATGVLNGCINYPASYSFGTGTLNNNNYYINSSNVQSRTGSVGGGAAANGGTFYTTLSAWKVATSLDASSYDVDPMFTSTSDLHINSGATPIGLESNGGSYGISTDYDNQVRPGGGGTTNGGGTLADIGADEFDGVPAPVMTYTGTTAVHTAQTACKGSGNVQILRFKIDVAGILTPFNFTSATFDLSATTALTDIIPSGCKLYSTGTTTTFNTSNLLTSANAASTLTLSGFNATLVNGSNYFWLTFDLAGNAGGGNNLDAALTSIILSGNTQSIGTSGNPSGTVQIGGPMSGTYTIGASGANYTSIGGAISDLVCREYGGAVVFELIDPAYNTLTGETFPIAIPIVTGASATNTLTLRPASGITTTISGVSASSLFTVAGADHFTIDGDAPGGTSNARDLTIQNLSNGANTGAIVIRSLGTGAGSTNITIKNTNIMAGSGSVATTTAISVGGNGVNTVGDDNDNITIQNNVISTAGTGLIVASNASGKSDNVQVLNNVFGSASSSDYLTQTAIRLQQVAGSTVSGNTIQNIFGATELTGAGISGVLLSDGVSTTTVTNNTIAGVAYTGANSFSGAGINLSGTNDNITISNNMIGGVNGTGANLANAPVEGQSVFGIALGGTPTSITVRNNTVSLEGTTTSVGPRSVSAALYVGTGATGLDVRGNILSNSLVNALGNTGTPGAFALYTNSGTTAFTSLNYNNYVTGGADSKFNYLSGTQYGTLAAWKAAFTADANSQNQAPSFTSASDLHLVKTGGVNCAIKGANDPTFAASTDIDGDTRGSLPGIGADNFEGTAAPTTATACSFVGNPSIMLRTSASGVVKWYSSATYPATQLDSISVGSNSMIAPGTAPTTIAAYVQDATDGCYSAPKLATITQRTGASTAVPAPAGTNKTYYATHEIVDGTWTHYCDCDNDLMLLSVEKGTWNPGTLVFDEAFITGNTKYAVRVDVGSDQTFNVSAVTPSNGRYAILANPWIVMNRTWDVKLFNGTQEPTASLKVRSYYNYDDFTAINTAMTNAGGSAVTNETDLTIYKLKAVSAPQGSMYANSWAALQAGHDGVLDANISPYHPSMATQWNWSLGYIGTGGPTSGPRSAEYTIASFSGGGGGGASGGAGAFPVEWLDFNAVYDNNVVNLDWTTATEVNVNHFDVERSQDGETFSSFGSVKAVGNTQAPTSYGYVDIAPMLGRNYYRIKSVDVSGHEQYTDQVQVFVGGNVAIFPNPASDELCVRMSSHSAATRIELYAPDGKLVQAKQLAANSSLVQKLDISELTPGMYLFKVIDGTEVVTGKFLKK